MSALNFLSGRDKDRIIKYLLIALEKGGNFEVNAASKPGEVDRMMQHKRDHAFAEYFPLCSDSTLETLSQTGCRLHELLRAIIEDSGKRSMERVFVNLGIDKNRAFMLFAGAVKRGTVTRQGWRIERVPVSAPSRQAEGRMFYRVIRCAAATDDAPSKTRGPDAPAA